MASRDSRSAFQSTLFVLGTLVIAACGGDKVKSEDGDSKSSQNECAADDTCDSFRIVCNSGTEVRAPGCRTESGCRTEDELPGDLCDGEGFDSVTIDDGEPEPKPEPDGGTNTSGGPLDTEEYCSDSLTVTTKLADREWTMDCGEQHKVCKDDDDGGASCHSYDIGDECPMEGSVACTADERAAVCKDNHIVEVELECLGGEKCTEYSATGTKNTITCGSDEDYRDYSIIGTPCGDSEGKAACSTDRTAVHVCRSGYWTLSRHCDPGACAIYTDPTDMSRSVDCSYGGYAVGDPCSFDAGNVVCSTDRMAKLACADGETVVKETCPAGQECKRILQDAMFYIDCAPAGYKVDDPCHFPEGTLLCSADNSAVLACRNKHMQLETTCEGGKTCQPGVAHGIPIGECK